MPALGSLAAEPPFVLTDTAIVGHLGRSQLAALGLAATILSALFALFNFLQYATTAQVARADGAGRRTLADSLGVQAAWLSLVAGVGIAALTIAFAPPAVEAFGAQGGPPTSPSPTCESPRSASRSPSSRSARRATCAAWVTCGRRC